MDKNSHVVPCKDGWAVKSGAKRSGRPAAASIYPTKQEAIDAGRSIAQQQGSDLIVHGSSGQMLHSTSPLSSLDEQKVRDAVRFVSSTTTNQSPAIKKSVAKKSTGKKEVNRSAARKSGAKKSVAKKSARSTRK